ncbi:hypothetical protein, partial [Pseudoalteromonas sp. SG44-1]|uniref:hypothetical protein n=1 Tax=Pseudoalteromonas sp. SG44-1 TaxID=2760964 RepID=UPI001C71E2B0
NFLPPRAPRRFATQRKSFVAKADSYAFSVVNLLLQLQLRGINPDLQNIFTTEAFATSRKAR